MTLTQDKYVL